MSRSQSSQIATIDSFIRQVGENTKTAEAKSEAGSIGGATSHPVKDVDDRLIEAKEGERSAENTKDVKADVPNSVDGTAEASKTAASIFDLAARFAKKADGAVSKPGSAESDHISTTTKVAPTGEDPKNETSSAKAGKEDPGSSHPARTDNDQLDGHKYAVDSNATLEKMAADMQELGDRLCSALAWDAHAAGADKTAAAAQVQSGGRTMPPVVKQAAVTDPALAQQLGYEMAGLVTNPDGFDKAAADALVRATLFDIIKTASDDADNYIAVANDFFKQAEGEEAAESPEMAGGGGGEEAGMMSALGGGEAADPAAGGGAGGSIDPEQLIQILEALGIDINQLAAQGGGGGEDPAAAGGMGGAPGGEVPGAEAAMAGMGAPPGGGGDPMAAAGGAPKMAADRGKAKKAADDGKAYIAELIGRSRRK